MRSASTAEKQHAGAQLLPGAVKHAHYIKSTVRIGWQFVIRWLLAQGRTRAHRALQVTNLYAVDGLNREHFICDAQLDLVIRAGDPVLLDK